MSWINVESSLPMLGERVFVYCSNSLLKNDWHTAFYSKKVEDKNGIKHIWNVQNWIYNTNKDEPIVTHWQPTFIAPKD